MLLLPQFTFARRVSFGVLFLVVAALVAAPPLVSACSTGLGSTQVRLNRGVEAPPSKCSLEPPAEAAPHAEPPDAVAPPRAFAPVASADEALPNPLLLSAPDDQRGPPRSRLL